MRYGNSLNDDKTYETIFLGLIIICIPFIMLIIFSMNEWEKAAEFMLYILLFGILYMFFYIPSSFMYSTTLPALIHALLWLLGYIFIMSISYDSKWIGEGTGMFISIFIIPYLLWKQLEKNESSLNKKNIE